MIKGIKMLYRVSLGIMYLMRKQILETKEFGNFIYCFLICIANVF